MEKIIVKFKSLSVQCINTNYPYATDTMISDIKSFDDSQLGVLSNLLLKIFLTSHILIRN